MKRLILALFLALPAFSAADFAPHNLTSNTSGNIRFTANSDTAYSGSYAAWRAFDGNNAGFWLASANVGILYLYSPSARYTLASYQIKATTGDFLTRLPKNWTLDASNDGVTWDTLDTRTNISWTDGQLQSFTCAVTGSYYSIFRLNVTAINTGDRVAVAELYLIGDVDSTQSEITVHDMASNSSHTPQVASASTYFASQAAYHAFDGDASSSTGGWIAANTGVDWLRLDLGVGNAARPTNYRILCTQFTGRSPRDWTFQGSNDGATWDTLDTQTGQTGWNINAPRFYPVATANAYRYFRFNMTANNNSGGDAAYSEIDELYILGKSGSRGGSYTAIME
jgi:hypothetical protein